MGRISLAQPLAGFNKSILKGDTAKAIPIIRAASLKALAKDSLKYPELFYDKWLLVQAQWGTTLQARLTEPVAYNSMQLALGHWQHINPKQQLRYIKWGQDSAYLVSRLATVDRDFVQKLLQQSDNAIASINSYLISRPLTNFRSQLIDFRDSMAFANLPRFTQINQQSIQPYYDFLIQYQTSAYRDRAKRQLQETVQDILIKTTNGTLIDQVLGIVPCASCPIKSLKDLEVLTGQEIRKGVLDTIILHRLQLDFPLRPSLAGSQLVPQLIKILNNIRSNVSLHTKPADLDPNIDVASLPLPNGNGSWQWHQGQRHFTSLFDSVPSITFSQNWPALIGGYKQGQFVYQFTVGDTTLQLADSVTYLGMGWYQLWHQGKFGLSFVGGYFKVPGPLTAATMVGDQVIWAKDGITTKLYSVLGLPLATLDHIDEIISERFEPNDQEFLLINKQGKQNYFSLTDPNKQQARSIGSDGYVYDDINLVIDDNLPVFVVTKGQNQAVVGATQSVIIPFGAYTINKVKSGWLLNSQGSVTFRAGGNRPVSFIADKILPSSLAMAFRKNGKWGILGYDAKELTPPIWDTVQILGQSIFLLSQGKQKALSFASQGMIDVTKYEKVEALVPLNGGDLAIPFFVTTSSDGSKHVFNQRNQLVYPELVLSADRPQSDLLIIRKLVMVADTVITKVKIRKRLKATKVNITTHTDERVGVVDINGRIIIPFVYDGITPIIDGGSTIRFSLLRDGRFGLATIVKNVTSNTSTNPSVLNKVATYTYKDTILPCSDRSLVLKRGGLAGTFQDQNWQFERNNQVGLILQNGDTILPPRYIQILNPAPNILLAKRSDTAYWETFAIINKSIVRSKTALRAITSVIQVPNDDPDKAQITIIRNQDSVAICKPLYVFRAQDYKLIKRDTQNYMVFWTGPADKRKVEVLVDFDWRYSIQGTLTDLELERLTQDQ